MASDIVIAPGIVEHPERRLGKPTIEGTRITVEEILSKLASDWSIDEILHAWPHLTRQQILNAIAYAAQLVHNVAVVAPGGDSEGDA